MECARKVETHVKWLEKQLGCKLEGATKDQLEEIYQRKCYTPKTVKWIKSILKKHNCPTKLKFNTSRYNEYPSRWLTPSILNTILDKATPPTKFVILHYACTGKQNLSLQHCDKCQIGSIDWTESYNNLKQLYLNGELDIKMCKHRKEFKKLSLSPRGVGIFDAIMLYRRSRLGD